MTDPGPAGPAPESDRDSPGGPLPASAPDSQTAGPSRHGNARGGDWDLGTGSALAAYVLGVVFLTVLGALFLPLSSVSDGTVSPASLVSQGALTLVAALIPAWILLSLAHGRPPGDLGFYLRPSAVGESLRGLGLGVGVTLAAVALMAAGGAVAWIEDGGTVVGLLGEGAVALGILALPAAAEEAFFRGYPLQLLSRTWGPGWALVATSVAFGLLHGANPGLTWIAMANLVVAGAFLGVVFLKTGSLWWATGAHLGWNWSLGFLTDLPVSGLEMVDTPIWTGVSSGPGWLGGGSFGPEGSLVTTVVVLVATVLLWRARWPSPGAAVRDGRAFAELIPGRRGAST